MLRQTGAGRRAIASYTPRTTIMVRLPLMSIQAELRRSLEHYFTHTQFQLGDAHKVARLRHWMELVYLRPFPLVAIDVEAWEQNPNKITEIGLAVYDPRDQWALMVPRIRTAHILVKENKSMNNGRYVPNNKMRFNGGVLYEMLGAELRGWLSEILGYYLNQRTGVLVGHNVGGDIEWLARHGVMEVRGIETVDTEKVHRLSRQTGGLLRGLLRTVQIPHLNLHNAANDAYYTLLVAMAYLDPAQRAHFGLDVYVPHDAAPGAPGAGRSAKARKRAERFSDNATVLPALRAPLPKEFMA